ncbi:hypothetical protein GCM10022238_23970 [Gordonia hankookensis]
MFPHAVAILAVWLLWVVIVPAIDSALPSEDPVVAGDRLSITPTLSFVPAPDWNVESGFRVGERGASKSVPPIELTRGNITFSVRADSFAGTPDELLTQIDAVGSATNGNSVLALAGSRQPFSTDAGLTGVQITFNTPSSAGSVTTFVVGGTGLSVQVVGPPDQITDRSEEIDAMISSIGPTEGRTP